MTVVRVKEIRRRKSSLKKIKIKGLSESKEARRQNRSTEGERWRIC